MTSGEVTAPQLEQAVNALIDRQAIEDCITRLARGVDRLDRELIISGYHPDGVDDHGKFIGGPEAFADWVIAMHTENHLSHQHALLNHSCDLEGGVAHCETYYMFVAINRHGPVLAMSGGRYIDRLEKRNDRWAITDRLCVRDWASVDERPDPDDFSAFTATRGTLSPELIAMMRCGPGPRRDKTDPSYRRPGRVDPARIAAWEAMR